MKKSRLSLYIGMPVFGLLCIPLSTVWPDLIYIDFIPVLFSIGLDDMIRGPPINSIFIVVVLHAVFWLPVAHGINMLWGHLEKRSKRNIRRDGLRFSVK
ncbi:MAG: hypothetical protein EB830_04960 [Nitrosopumilus sp. H13]|nr:MAG: hypothetical protein EB830_04960 [Nitrosopumilus sp. H13]